MKNGIYNNIDIDEYHASEGISSTGVSLILDCPARYYYEFQQKQKALSLPETQKQYDKYELGRAIHMLVLEPAKFDANFYCMTEKVNLATKAGKEAYAEAQRIADGRKILRTGEWEDIKAMANSICKNKLWSKLGERQIEASVFWEDGTYKTKLRARPDVFNSDLIIDVKTTDSIKQFSKSIYNYGYHRQAAMQIDGLITIDGSIRQFAFFVVEKKAPYLTACFVLDKESIEQGRREYHRAAEIYSECLESNTWPGYGDQFQMISIPIWAKEGANNE